MPATSRRCTTSAALLAASSPATPATSRGSADSSPSPCCCSVCQDYGPTASSRSTGWPSTSCSCSLCQRKRKNDTQRAQRRTKGINHSRTVGWRSGGELRGSRPLTFAHCLLVHLPACLIPVCGPLACSRRFPPVSCSSMLVSSGVLVNGPYTLVSSAVAADLGSHPSLRGNPKAMSTVTGIIDGCGSVGAALQGVIIGLAGKRMGWTKGQADTTGQKQRGQLVRFFFLFFCFCFFTTPCVSVCSSVC